MKMIIGNPKLASMAYALFHSTPLLTMKKRIYWHQTRHSRWPPRLRYKFVSTSTEFSDLISNTIASKLNDQTKTYCNWDNSSSKSSSNSSSKSSKISSHDTITTTDRRALGLSVTEPLNIEDVKIAYRACALKWHPDHHQGVAKEFAEQKFKACNAAYESICNKLSAK